MIVTVYVFVSGVTDADPGEVAVTVHWPAESADAKGAVATPTDIAYGVILRDNVHH